MQLDETQMAILMTQVGQETIQTLEGLLTGKKRLVIKAKPRYELVKNPYRADPGDGNTLIATDYVIKVEDV